MSTSAGSEEHARRLLAVATDLGTPRRVDALARVLRPAFELAPRPAGAHGRSDGAAADSTLQAMEAAHIRAALERSGGVIEGQRGAAELLGLKGSTLRFRMKRLGIRRPGAR